MANSVQMSDVRPDGRCALASQLRRLNADGDRRATSRRVRQCHPGAVVARASGASALLANRINTKARAPNTKIAAEIVMMTMYHGTRWVFGWGVPRMVVKTSSRVAPQPAARAFGIAAVAGPVAAMYNAPVALLGSSQWR